MTSLRVNSETNFKTRTMRRIYRVWFLRRAAPLLSIELALLAGVLAGVLAYISPRQILLNAHQPSSGLSSFVQFFIDNFFVKSIQSRLLLAMWLGFMVYVIRDLRAVFSAFRAFPLRAKARPFP